MSLSPPPSREKLPVVNGQAEMPRTWIKWFTDIKELLAPVSTGGLMNWTVISKDGANLTDLTTRNHADLQNINTADYTHLTELDHTDLTDGGITILHKHTHNLEDGLQGGTTDEYYHLSLTHHTDLTDSGDSALHYHSTDRARANHTGTQDTTTITIASIGGTTTLQNSRNDTGSAGYVDGFAITDTGGGNISVAAGECTVRSSASRLAQIYHVTIPGATSLSVPTNTVRHVVVDYNAGSPVVQLDTTIPAQFYTKCYIAEVHNHAGSLHIHFDPRATGDLGNRVINWADGLIGFRVESGDLLSSVATTRTIAVTASTTWDGHFNQFSEAAIDTSVSDTFALEYRDGAGGFTEVASQTAWPNTQYDNGTGTLATLSNNKWGVLWFIREVQNGIYCQYGQAEYANQSDAELAAPPTTRPDFITKHGYYIAKLVFQKSATTYAVIQDYRPIIGSSSSASSVSNHENLSGLQGGTAGEYYHLTSAQKTIADTVLGASPTAAFDLLAPTTTQGDIIYHNGTDNVRLAKGTAAQVLTMNAGATAPEWAAPTGSSTVSNVIASPVSIAADTSYLVIGYLNVNSDLTVSGNLGVI